jgi:hypothetical protein
MNKKIILSIAFLLSITTLYAGDYKNSEANNIKVVDAFWENILTNPSVSMDLLHDDFQFEFMGICEICQKYNKETYESEWLGKVIPEVLPNGILINITNRIADKDWVIYTVEGEATAINGDYNNNYVMVMKLKDGKIIFFQEYMSDLLAETRLHKKKIVDIE